MVKNRVLSFSLIISLGFLLLISLAFATVLEVFVGRLRASFPDVSVVLLYIANQVFTFGVAAFIFGIIFKVLPDARVAWRDVWIGAALTSFLFTIGKFSIGFYLGKSDVGSAYGAAGSLVILLVWVYYSAQILLFGAEFTQVYANRAGSRIVPTENAVSVNPQKAVVEPSSNPAGT